MLSLGGNENFLEPQHELAGGFRVLVGHEAESWRVEQAVLDVKETLASFAYHPVVLSQLEQGISDVASVRSGGRNAGDEMVDFPLVILGVEVAAGHGVLYREEMQLALGEGALETAVHVGVSLLVGGEVRARARGQAARGRAWQCTVCAAAVWWLLW